MYIKLIWFLRYILYKTLFQKSFTGVIGYIGRPIYISGIKKVRIGSRFRIYPHCRIEVFKSGNLLIGKNVSIGQNLHLTCAKKIEIKDNTVVTCNVTITDITHEFTHLKIPRHKQKITASSTVIGENCFLGANVVINAGSKIGDNCTIGANSFVCGSFPSNSIIAGTPAKIINYHSF